MTGADPRMADWNGPVDEAYFAEQARRRMATVPAERRALADRDPDGEREAVVDLRAAEHEAAMHAAVDVALELEEAERLRREGWREAPLGPLSEAGIAEDRCADPQAHRAASYHLEDRGTGQWTCVKCDGQARLAERFGVRPLATISTDPPPPMLIGRLDPEGHTILYGTGGVGKGAVASSWIVELVAAGHRVLIVDYEHHPTEWARRIFGLGGADAMAGVDYVAPLTAAWHGIRGPLWQQVAELRALARMLGCTYTVIDSIVPACAGNDPMKPETVALYAGALEYLELPTLSLAHVTKAEDLVYPFGSAFWHHLARMTWSLKRDGERAILQHRKHNNYSALGRFAVTITWRDDLPREVDERGYSAALADRIDEVLGEDELTVAELATRLAEDDDEAEPVKADSIRAALRRGIRADPQRFSIEGTGQAAKYRRLV